MTQLSGHTLLDVAVTLIILATDDVQPSPTVCAQDRFVMFVKCGIAANVVFSEPKEIPAQFSVALAISMDVYLKRTFVCAFVIDGIENAIFIEDLAMKQELDIGEVRRRHPVLIQVDVDGDAFLGHSG